MSATFAVMKRELRGYFGTPVAYLFLFVFLLFSAHLTFSSGFFEMRDASLRVFFQGLPLLFMLFAPAIAMRMWSEERRSGTIELLLTLPVTIKQAVLGKFLAGWVFLAIALLLTLSIVVTVSYLGDPDYGPIFTGYLGAFLMAGAFLAIGGFFSALTKNPVIAWVLGVLGCAVFTYVGSPSVLQGITWLPSAVTGMLEHMSFLTHYDVMQRGLLEFRNVIYMVAVIVAFLVFSNMVIRVNKAR